VEFFLSVIARIFENKQLQVFNKFVCLDIKMKLYNEGEEHPKVVDITKMMLGCSSSNIGN
jgi:hypothetical protein